MNWESWFKIGLPALPTAFSLFGVWLYWGENPLPILAPSVGFWGVMIAFYLFTHIYLPQKRSPFYFAVFSACLWLVSSITSRNLSHFLLSDDYTGLLSLLKNKDLWYSYIMSGTGFAVALSQFMHHEPRIAAEAELLRKTS
jgi:hypothetical protein